VHPNRIGWCPALRSDKDVAIAVLNAHQWGLTDILPFVSEGVFGVSFLMLC
jgi:hypothetical protein